MQDPHCNQNTEALALGRPGSSIKWDTLCPKNSITANEAMVDTQDYQDESLSGSPSLARGLECPVQRSVSRVSHPLTLPVFAEPGPSLPAQPHPRVPWVMRTFVFSSSLLMSLHYQKPGLFLLSVGKCIWLLSELRCL